MKTTPFKTLLLVTISLSAAAQAPIKKFVDKTGTKSITNQILKVFRGADSGNKDGHGKFPYLSSAQDIPDTIALITYYAYSGDVSKVSEVKGAYITTTYVETYNISPAGGNYYANQLHQESIGKLKSTFLKHGIVLLTPDEYLNTPEKRNFYYKEFQPKISKLGKFLSGLENKKTDMAVCADYYRGFDEAAAEDFIRAISLGDELAKKLGVDAVLSIAIQLSDDQKVIGLHQVKWTLNGPNPIAKQDKKYPGAFGAGYQEGLVYFSSLYETGRIELASWKGKGKNKALADENYEGFGDLLACFAEATVERMKDVVSKNSK